MVLVRSSFLWVIEKICAGGVEWTCIPTATEEATAFLLNLLCNIPKQQKLLERTVERR